MMDTSLVKGPPEHAFVLFHSPGGENKAGLQLHEFLAHWSDRITVFNMGYVCSAELTMFLAIPLERRLMAEHAVFMAHEVSMGVHGEATESELAAYEETRTKESERVRDILCGETNLTRVEWDSAAKFDLEIWRDRKDAIESRLVARIGGFWLPDNVHIIEL